MQAAWDRARVRPVTPLLSELQTCRGSVQQLWKSLPVEGCDQHFAQPGMTSVCVIGWLGRVLGCSVQFTWVVPSSLGSEASADRDTVFSSGH